MLPVARLTPDSKLPTRETTFSPGLDLYSRTTYIIEPQSMGIIETGLAVALPNGMYGQIAPVWSLSLEAIDVAASIIVNKEPIKVVLFNHSKSEDFLIEAGDKVAQIIIKRILYPKVKEIDYNNLDCCTKCCVHI